MADDCFSQDFVLRHEHWRPPQAESSRGSGSLEA